MNGNENVIEVSFKQQHKLQEDVDLLVDLDDPLEELLAEFNDLEDELSAPDPVIRTNKASDFQFNFSDTSLHMTDTLIKQMAQIKEDMDRLSYYLDEINIEG